MTPEQRAHLHEVTSRMYEEVKAGSPALNVRPRTLQETALDMLYETVEAIVAMSHERTVVDYGRRQLERIDVLRGK